MSEELLRINDEVLHGVDMYGIATGVGFRYASLIESTQWNDWQRWDLVPLALRVCSSCSGTMGSLEAVKAFKAQGVDFDEQLTKSIEEYHGDTWYGMIRNVGAEYTVILENLEPDHATVQRCMFEVMRVYAGRVSSSKANHQRAYRIPREFRDGVAKYAKKAMRAFLRNGVDLQERDVNGQTPLVFAINMEEGAYTSVATILEEGGPPVFGGDEFFIHALSKGDLNILKLLVRRKADVNMDSAVEGTVIHAAASKAVETRDMAYLKIFQAKGRERRARGGGWTLEGPVEDLTPTEYIQKKYGGDVTRADALQDAVQMLRKFRG